MQFQVREEEGRRPILAGARGIFMGKLRAYVSPPPLSPLDTSLKLPKCPRVREVAGEGGGRERWRMDQLS